MAVGGARGAELDDPPSFCFCTAVLWTSSWLRLALIDWPVRVRRCAHGQNEPRCCTRVNKCLLRPPGKLRVKPEPLLSSQQSPPSTDRIGQDGLIHKTATWLLELHHAGFWPCMDLRGFPDDVAPCFSERPAGTCRVCGCSFTLRYSTLNCRFVWKVDDEWSLRLFSRKLMENSAFKNERIVLSPLRPLVE